MPCGKAWWNECSLHKATTTGRKKRTLITQLIKRFYDALLRRICALDAVQGVQTNPPASPLITVSHIIRDAASGFSACNEHLSPSVVWNCPRIDGAANPLMLYPSVISNPNLRDRHDGIPYGWTRRILLDSL